MKQKVYQKPTMHVVKLQQQSIICSSPGQAGSPDQAGVQNYNWDTETEE